MSWLNFNAERERNSKMGFVKIGVCSLVLPLLKDNCLSNHSLTGCRSPIGLNMENGKSRLVNCSGPGPSSKEPLMLTIALSRSGCSMPRWKWGSQRFIAVFLLYIVCCSYFFSTAIVRPNFIVLWRKNYIHFERRSRENCYATLAKVVWRITLNRKSRSKRSSSV